VLLGLLLAAPSGRRPAADHVLQPTYHAVGSRPGPLGDVAAEQTENSRELQQQSQHAEDTHDQRARGLAQVGTDSSPSRSSTASELRRPPDAAQPANDSEAVGSAHAAASRASPASNVRRIARRTSLIAVREAVHEVVRPPPNGTQRSASNRSLPANHSLHAAVDMARSITLNGSAHGLIPRLRLVSVESTRRLAELAKSMASVRDASLVGAWALGLGMLLACCCGACCVLRRRGRRKPEAKPSQRDVVLLMGRTDDTSSEQRGHAPPAPLGWCTPLQQRALVMAAATALCKAMDRWRNVTRSESLMRLGGLVDWHRRAGDALDHWKARTSHLLRHS
jgi:hypothetical protein